MAGKTRTLLAKRLRQLRQKRGYTQQDVAERSGLDYKYYQRIEGKNPPNVTVDSLERLAKAFGVPSYELLEPEPPT